ncbi:MAG: hypothetical protein LBJ41_01800 [Treponema sp.]|jgi:hypothetical protein|nr:hypothetical protein [Treponema sp.]
MSNYEEVLLEKLEFNVSSVSARFSQVRDYLEYFYALEPKKLDMSHIRDNLTGILENRNNIENALYYANMALAYLYKLYPELNREEIDE